MHHKQIITAGATEVDFLLPNGLNGFSAQGSLASMLLSGGFKVQQLRPYTLLRKDEWKALDTALIEVARGRMRGVNDLISAGLTYNLNNAMGTTRLEWERISDMNDAEVNMSGLTNGENDRVEFDLVGLPIPIIHKSFQINARALAASRSRGEPLDTTQAMIAGRKVAEKTESLLFSGGYSIGTYGSIYGYQTALNRNTGSVTATWTTTTGANILADTLEMISVAQGDHMYGPYIMYVPTLVYNNLQNDFKDESDRTILERLLAIPQILDIRESEYLTASNILLIQMTRDVVDMVVGMQPTVVQWESQGGMTMHFKVMSIMVPRMKSDFNLQSGIVHYS